MPPPSIILTADDYGATPFIDKGIIKAIEEGIVNSVAVFVTFPDSRERIDELLTLKAKEAAKGNTIGIGLHFSVTAGSPVIRERNSLTQPGSKDIVFRKAKNYPFHKVLKEEVREELQAQIDTLASWVGGVDKIDHISNHHGVTYIDSRLFKAYANQVAENNIPIRSPLSWSKSRLCYMDFTPFVPSVPIAAQGAKLRWMEKIFETGKKKINTRVQYAKDAGIRFPYCVSDTVYGQPFVENIDFLVNQFSSEAFRSLDTQCAEMMFHLGIYEQSPFQKHPDEGTGADGIDQSYFANRKLELNAIRRFNWQTALNDNGIQKITYRQIS